MTNVELRAKLEQEVDRISIKPLIVHFERHALWLVEDSINLVDAAMAIVQDDAKQVGAWITSECLKKPTQEEIDKWKAQVLAQHFEFIIVQPYVLAKLHLGGEADWRKAQATASEETKH